MIKLHEIWSLKSNNYVMKDTQGMHRIVLWVLLELWFWLTRWSYLFFPLTEVLSHSLHKISLLFTWKEAVRILSSQFETWPSALFPVNPVLISGWINFFMVFVIILIMVVSEWSTKLNNYPCRSGLCWEIREIKD